MYYEPDRKTYYRFPSQGSVQNFDAKFFFPENTYASGESIHYNHTTERQNTLNDIELNDIDLNKMGLH